MAPKSIWRQPNAVHFQLVHRSQRDIMRHDPDAGAGVLKPFEPLNRAGLKGKSRAELMQEDPSLGAEGDDALPRKNIGQAALYGIYYDDTEYDYMQHLRAINDTENSMRGGVDEEDDTEAVWIPSAVPSKQKAPSFAWKDDEKKHDLMLPSSAFASEEISLSQAYDDATPQGLQPDMDPHLRQTLEALDDDAFVDDDLNDDFFQDLVQDGVWSGQREAGDEWRDAAPEGDDIWLDPVDRAKRELASAGGDESALSLEARVALFKARAKAADSDEEDEERDTLGELGPPVPRRVRPSGSVSSSGSALGKKGKPGALARRAASTKAGSVSGASSAWSMTSSSMYRNPALTELDSQFDQVIRNYGGQATGDPELDALHGAFDDVQDDEEDEELDSETAEKLTRSDLDAILDEFLDHHEVIGGKLKQTLGDRTTTADEKLDIVRRELGEARITDTGDDDEEVMPSKENPFLNPDIIGRDREQWDVETIQTTKTNLENHPRTIPAAESVRGSCHASTAAYTLPQSITVDGDDRIPKIRLHPRTGMPQIVGYTTTRKTRKASSPTPKEDEDVNENGDEDDGNASDATIDASKPGTVHKRDRNESKEARRQRKEAVKNEKQQRRIDKASAKKAFSDERKRQNHAARRQTESRGGASGVHLA